MIKQSSYFKCLCLILILKACLIIAVILFGRIGLGPDEAQYWTWSQVLDWGYYSKPPGIAWQIWLGTKLLGHTELGVRFVSILISIVQALSIYFLAIQCRLKDATAFWAGILMAFSPLGTLGSFLAITDSGFLLFWTLACGCFCAALKEQHLPNPFLIGILIACGALFKWPIYFFWVFYFIFRWYYFPRLNLLKEIGGFGLSLLGLLPSIWWNASHDWVTFRHVFSTVQGGHNSAGHTGNFFEFFGAQILLISPILFVLLIIAIWKWIKLYAQTSLPIKFCGGVLLGSLTAMLIVSLFQKIQGNWGVFAYPTSFILIGWYACETFPQRQMWLKWAAALSIALMAILLLMPHVSSIIPMTYKSNPFKHNMGWEELNRGLVDLGYRPEQDYLLSDKYQTTSVLSFYGPQQKRAYFLNLQGVRRNQFSYWPQLQAEQQDKIGYFVWIENTPHLQREWKSKLSFYQGELEKYFKSAEFVGVIPLILHENTILKGAFIFKCKKCLDNCPEESYAF